jgi:hypothetical protein
LLGTTGFDSQQKVKVRSIDGSIAETRGIVKIWVHDGELNIPFDFHLVNKQVELVYDGIVGRHFVQHTRAEVCYDSNTVIFKTESAEWTKKILGNEIVQATMKMRKLTLRGRSEVTVKLPLGNGTDDQEGTIDKSEIAGGVYLTRISGNHVVTRVLNSNEADVVLEMRAIKWEKYDTEEFREGDPNECVGSLASVRTEKTRNRIREVLEKVRLHHLNPEKKEIIRKTCRDYHNIYVISQEIN